MRLAGSSAVIAARDDDAPRLSAAPEPRDSEAGLSTAWAMKSSRLLVHLEPCPSCRDHDARNIPNWD